MYLTTDLEGNLISFTQSRIVPEIKLLYEKGILAESSRELYHEWVVQLPKDEMNNPIKPDLEIKIYRVESNLENQIQEYLNENGEESITELQYDSETNTVTIFESEQLKRLKSDKVKFFRDQAQLEILEVYPLWKQNNINNLLFGSTQEDKDEMNTFIGNIVQKCNDLEQLVESKRKAETLEEIIWNVES